MLTSTLPFENQAVPDISEPFDRNYLKGFKKSGFLENPQVYIFIGSHYEIRVRSEKLS